MVESQPAAFLLPHIDEIKAWMNNYGDTYPWDLIINT